MASRQQETSQLERVVGSRIHEREILAEYNTRTEDHYLSTWKDQIQKDQRLYRGDYDQVFTEEAFLTPRSLGPQIMNVPMTFADDLSRLVCESTPTLRCRPRSDKKNDVTTARVEEAVGLGYWEDGEGDRILPFFVGDIAVAGAAFAAVRTKRGRDYPIPFRLDPQGCYPTWDGIDLVDLVVIDEVNARVAAHRFPDTFPNLRWEEQPYGANPVKIMEWHRPDQTITAAIGTTSAGEGTAAFYLRDPIPNSLGCLSVAGVRRPTADGRMRGLFSGAGGKLLVAARIITLLLDAADLTVYAQPVQRDTDWEQVKGHLDKPITLQTDQAVFSRQNPIELNPQLFQVLQFLMSQIRDEIGYPEQRQGGVDQSIASASFVGAVLGQLTTTVRAVARDTGYLQEDWTNIAYHVDRLALDFEKPLCRPVGKKGMYQPSADFSEYPRCRVIFGTGAGLDKLNQRAVQYQALGYGVMGTEDVMEQMDDIADIEQTKNRVAMDRWNKVMEAQAQQDPAFGLQGSMAVIEELSNGTSEIEAIKKVREQQQQMAQQMAQQPLPPGQPGQPGAGVESENASVVRGGTPQSPALENQGEPPTPLPPAQDVMVQ